MNQPPETAVYLRQALKLLGLTNKRIAQELTNIRLDGQKTAEATVSRWISGASSADPGLLLYMKERLIRLAEESLPRLDRCRVIAVGGGKGGCGGSTIAAALTLIARDRKYRACFVSLSPGCNNTYFTKRPVNDFEILSLDEWTRLSGRERAFDFVFIDVPSRQYAYGDRLPQTLLDEIDLIALPLDLSFLPDLEIGIRACEALDDIDGGPPRMLVQSARHAFLTNFPEGIRRIQPWIDSLYEVSVYIDTPFQYHVGVIAGTWKFTSTAAVNLFGGLFDGVCDRLGIDGSSQPISIEETREMDLFELIDRLSQLSSSERQ